MTNDQDPHESQTVPIWPPPRIDLLAVAGDPNTVLVRLETYNSGETVDFGPEVYVEDRPLIPTFRVSKAELREYFVDLIRRIDSLT